MRVMLALAVVIVRGVGDGGEGRVTCGVGDGAEGTVVCGGDGDARIAADRIRCSHMSTYEGSRRHGRRLGSCSSGWRRTNPGMSAYTSSYC
ncbi:hypothetical protein DFH09DRAFT_1207313 [Mycena vulgaris]|nr:hypothetical protein DFH09DRAFT_1207313 [Mycena vulgaris]